MDVNKPVTNSKLLYAIKEMQEDGAKENFIRELSRANFLCPAIIKLKNPASGKGERITAGEGSTISLISINDQQGKPYLMAFTDWMEVRKWNREEDVQTLIFTYGEYQKILAEGDSPYAGFVINPYGANIVMNKTVLEGLYSDQMTMQEGESVMIGLPQDYPTGMVEKLKQVFREIPETRSAYLLWMIRNNEKSYLLVLDAGGSEQKLFPIVGEICKAYLKENFLDMVSLNSQFGQRAVENQKPFYMAFATNF